MYFFINRKHSEIEILQNIIPQNPSTTIIVWGIRHDGDVSNPPTQWVSDQEDEMPPVELPHHCNNFLVHNILVLFAAVFHHSMNSLLLVEPRMLLMMMMMMYY